MAYWLVNSSRANTGRTTETLGFYTLHEARGHGVGRHGYIIRYDTDGMGQAEVKLHEYFGNFEPTATESERIKGILEGIK